MRSFNFLASTYTHLADQYYKVMTMIMMIMIMTVTMIMIMNMRIQRSV